MLILNFISLLLFATLFVTDLLNTFPSGNKAFFYFLTDDTAHENDERNSCKNHPTVMIRSLGKLKHTSRICAWIKPRPSKFFEQSNTETCEENNQRN